MATDMPLERLLAQAGFGAPVGELMDIDVPGIPGAANQWFSSQGQARKAALVAATRLGPGHRIVHDANPGRGQPHYHVTNPQGGRVSGHFFYARRPPRRVYRGRPWREYEALQEAGALERTLRAADPAIGASLGELERMAGEAFLPAGLARGATSIAGRFWAEWGRQLRIAQRMFTQARYGCWCGPGNVCTGVTDNIDRCCQAHDEAYARAGVTSGSGPGISMWSIAGLRRTRAADLTLVRCTQATLFDPHWYGPAAAAYRAGVAAIFGTRAAAATAAMALGL